MSLGALTESAEVGGFYSIGDRSLALWSACCGTNPTFTFSATDTGSPSLRELPLQELTQKDLTTSDMYPLLLTFDASEITEEQVV